MQDKYEIFDISNDKHAPKGDPELGYPQLCIRTNRTVERSDIDKVIEIADEAANQFPVDDKENRQKAVMKILLELFGGGSFGHTWVIFFNSSKDGDYTSYGYHNNYGFVKNGTESDRNDRPDRAFHIQKCIKLDVSKNYIDYPSELEKTIIPKLNKESYSIAKIIGLDVAAPMKGAYTPINNCAWFAGNLWNYATGDSLVFEQDFDGAAHAEEWGMIFLSLVKKIADPGMVAESINSDN